MKSKFAERLRELRRELGFSTLTLGKLINVSDTTVCNWENGKHDIKGEQLIKLAKVLSTSADYILGIED